MQVRQAPAPGCPGERVFRVSTLATTPPCASILHICDQGSSGISKQISLANQTKITRCLIRQHAGAVTARDAYKSTKNVTLASTADTRKSGEGWTYTYIFGARSQRSNGLYADLYVSIPVRWYILEALFFEVFVWVIFGPHGSDYVSQCSGGIRFSSETMFGICCSKKKLEEANKDPG